MEKVTITFKDGTQIEAERNGDSLITDDKPTFPVDLSEVTITGEDEEKELNYAEIVECAAIDERYWFALIEVPEAVRESKQIRADIDYIALETGVEL